MRFVPPFLISFTLIEVKENNVGVVGILRLLIILLNLKISINSNWFQQIFEILFSTHFKHFLGPENA